jgi:hypothetical protein
MRRNPVPRDPEEVIDLFLSSRTRFGILVLDLIVETLL